MLGSFPAMASRITRKFLLEMQCLDTGGFVSSPGMQTGKIIHTFGYVKSVCSMLQVCVFVCVRLYCIVIMLNSTWVV